MPFLPCRHVAGVLLVIFLLSGQATDEDRDVDSRRSRKRLTSPERWEAAQLIASGVLKVHEYPTYDDDTGMGLLNQDLEAEEEYEIDINEEEPMFLKGQSTKTGVEVRADGTPTVAA